MFKLTAKVLGAFMLASVAGLLSGCGNKGDLFLVPDQMTEQELLRLEQSLGGTATTPIDPDSTSEAASEPGDDDPDDSGNPTRKPSTSRN